MKALLLLLTLLCLCPPAALADGAAPDYGAFSRLPVQHEGRIKPVDTFARGFLKLLSGRERLSGADADAWLAQTLFDPAQALNGRVFRLYTPGLLGLPAREDHLYAYAEIAPALNARAGDIHALLAQDEKSWSEGQRELARIQELSILYAQLLRSFSFILPLNIAVPESLSKAWNIRKDAPFTLQEYGRYRQRLEDRVRRIVTAKGEDPAAYTAEERRIATFGFDLQVMERAGADNVLFRILPGAQGGEWFSPWAMMEQGQGTPAAGDYLSLWRDMADAYAARDADAWAKASNAARDFSDRFAGTDKTGLELLYNAAHPLGVAVALYLLAFFAYLYHGVKHSRRARLASLFLLGAGTAAHLAAIALRVAILERPPVGTLYESILFVGLVCAAIGAAMEVLRKDGTGLAAGSLSGLILLFCAMGFAEQDTMKMLVAVLNTNFWLATHVLCITMGYGWCVIASIAAHLWLLKRARGRDGADLVTPVRILALVALFFTAFGTILGGIWADQSWGRFWGWDPKENGALLIVLWLVWLLHAQLAGQLSRGWFMAGMAALSIVVALAWFGVNLLSIGLHSYGFITGVAASLAAFCAAELLLISALFYKGRKAP